MIRRSIVLGLAGAVAAFACPAMAQTAPVPGNSVSCVYDYLSVEDREMALLLVAREIVDRGGFAETSPNVMAVDRLIEDAHQRCLDRFNWSIMRSRMSTDFALTAILGEALFQALESFGRPLSPLGDYYRENRGVLSARRKLDEGDGARLFAHLEANGWEDAQNGELDLALLYLETLIQKDQAARYFAMAGGATRQPTRHPPARARSFRAGKAVRGTP